MPSTVFLADLNMPENQPSDAKRVLRFIFLILGGSGAYTIWREYFRDDYLAQSLDAGNWGMLIVVLIMVGLVILCFFAWSALGERQSTPEGHTSVDTNQPAALASTRQLRITLTDGEAVKLNDLAVTLDGKLVLDLIGVCKDLDRGSLHAPTPARIESLKQLTQDDEIAASWLHNTAKAFSDQHFLSILTNDTVQSAPSVETLASEIIRPIQERFPNFFSDCPPEEREFVVCWASRLVMTSDRVVIFSNSAAAEVMRTVPISQIIGIESIESEGEA